MNASSNVSQLDALHLELLHAAIPQQYDTIGVMMPGVAGRIGCRASAYRSAAKRLCRSGAENVESLLAAFLSDAQCRRTQGRGYVQEVLWTVMLAASQVEGINAQTTGLRATFWAKRSRISHFRRMKRQPLPFWMRSSSRGISGAYGLRWCLCSRTWRRPGHDRLSGPFSCPQHPKC